MHDFQEAGVLPGLGTHAQWDRKLDGRLAQALMSIQAIKGVEIGLGFEMARRRGSQVHDEIFFDPAKMVTEGTPRIVPTGFYRGSNNSGGTEGGMTNGAPLIARVAMKPISTLMSPLQSVDLRSKQPADASVERSDVCAAPAAAVVGESVVAFELAGAFLERHHAVVSATLLDSGEHLGVRLARLERNRGAEPFYRRLVPESRHRTEVRDARRPL